MDWFFKFAAGTCMLATGLWALTALAVMIGLIVAIITEIVS